MTGAFRFAWRVQRFEIVAMALFCAGVAGWAVLLAIDHRSILATCGTTAVSDACDHSEMHVNFAALLRMVAPVVPFGVGLVLGVPAVSREVEHRTAGIAWSLSRSRLRWLAWRVMPSVAIGLALVAVPAAAVDDLTRTYTGPGDLGFVDYDLRGVPVLTRAAFALAAGIGIGAVLGRVMPALLVGIGLSIAVSISLTAALPNWLPPAELHERSNGTIVTQILYRMPDGTPLGNEEGEEVIMEAYQAAIAAGFEEPDPATLPQEVPFGIASDRYPEVLVRESVLLGAATLLAAALAVFAVLWRRPA